MVPTFLLLAPNRRNEYRFFYPYQVYRHQAASMATVLLRLGHVLELVQGHENLVNRRRFQLDLWSGELSAQINLRP